LESQRVKLKNTAPAKQSTTSSFKRTSTKRLREVQSVKVSKPSSRVATKSLRQTVKPVLPPKQIRHFRTPSVNLGFTRSSWFKFVPLVFGAIFFLLLINLLLRFLFSVNYVACTINSSDPCPPILISRLHVVNERSLFFTDFHDLLWGLHNHNLDFSGVSYLKVFPHTLRVNFDFESPAYQINSGGETFYLNAEGSFYFRSGSGLFTINDYHGSLHGGLMNFTLDGFIHQKIMELIFYFEDSGLNFNTVYFYDIEQIVIPDGEHLYIISLTNLDEDLQKLAFTLANHEFGDIARIVDFRFRLPVLRTDIHTPPFLFPEENYNYYDYYYYGYDAEDEEV
jgi:hypothetical protein